MTNNNGNNNGNPSLEDLLRMAMEEATASPSGGSRTARPKDGPVAPSPWVAGLPEADQAVMMAAGWQDCPGSFKHTAGKVVLHLPVLAKPKQQPSREGKVRGASSYDEKTAAKMKAENKKTEDAKYQLIIAIAATLSRANNKLSMVDLCAMALYFNLQHKETWKTTIDNVATRLNLPLEVKNGMISTSVTIPTHTCHTMFAQVANMAIAAGRNIAK